MSAPTPGSAPISRRRLWSKRLLALTISLVLGLALVEMAARLLQLAPPVYPEADTAIVLYHEDPNGPIKLTPHWKGYVGYVWTEINEHGFRDRVFPSQPPAATVRVVAIGDSYTMGDAVPLEASYPKQLESLLASAHRCEVMNCGQSATNTQNQLETLRDVLSEYHPHIVVLGLNINDFAYPKKTRFDNLQRAGYSYSVHPDKRVTLNRELTWSQRVRMELYNNSYFWRWLANMKRAWESRCDPQNELAEGVSNWIEAGGHQRCFAAVEEMQRLCHKEGVLFRVYVIPDLVRVSRSIGSMRDYPFKNEHAMMVDQLTARGIQCVDLLSEFGDRNARQLEAHAFDHHYNREGNEIIAKVMAHHLENDIQAAVKRIRHSQAAQRKP